MNISDSQRIAAKLNELGYQSASENEADLVIVNSCSVRQKGIDRIWGGIKKWQAAKKRVLITGCILDTDKAHFKKKNIETFNIKELSFLDDILKKNKQNKIDVNYFDIKPNEILNVYGKKIAYVPIGTGCDNFCTYCAVPYTRGREVSRPINDIISDTEDAIQKGAQEIWLLGQNVNSYGVVHRPLSTVHRIDNNKFIDLLNTVDGLDGDFKFNFISSNPHDMGDELIECFGNLKKWTRELHLALQSGDDEILKKMNRKYTAEQYLKLVKNLKLKIKNLKLSTDIIVGFPTETEEQFEHTVDVCKKAGFIKAYVNQYSPRAGTVSAKTMEDDVPAEEKKRRWQILDQLINKG